MADKKITQLNSITGDLLVNVDEFVVVDISADETKSVTREEFFKSTPDITIGDGQKAIFGDGGDLKVYHVANSASYISEEGTGSLIIQGNGGDISFFDTVNGAYMVKANTGGDVQLSHSGSVKISTTSIGVDITGSLTSEGLTVAKSETTTYNGAATDGQLSIGATSFIHQTGDSDSGVSQLVFQPRTGYGYNRIVNSGGSAPFMALTTNNAERLRIDSGGDISFYEDTGQDVKFFWDSSSESLGIGTATPRTGLHLRGAGQATAAVSDSGNLGAFLRVSDTGLLANNGGGVVFGTEASEADGFAGFAAVKGLLVDGDNNTLGDLAFSTRATNTATALTERMRLTAGGNVGIATGAPDALLNVGGTGTALGGTAGDEVKLLTLEAASANRDRLQFTSERITTGADWESAAHRIQRMVDTTTMGYMQFGHPGNPYDLISFGKTDEEFMRILGTGDLLIGTTAVIDAGAENSLQILGSTTSAKWCIVTKSESRGHIHYNTGLAGISHFFLVNNNNVGLISHDQTSTAYTTSSDYRLKTDAQPMTGAAARVQELNPVNFEWIVSGKRVDGFLAHEAQEVVPECATGTRDGMKDEEYEVTPAVLDDYGSVITEAVMDTRSVPDYQGIDQSKLVPLLTSALQEALTKIEAIETRLTALEE